MKILDWNVCSFNRNQSRTVTQALNFKADIICLQEVVPQSLQLLKQAHEYNVAETLDSDSKNGGCYLVILSRFKILNVGIFTYYTHPVRSLASVLIGTHTKEQEKHDALYVDLQVNESVLRVYNIHISWPVTPSIRVAQFTNFTNIVKEQPHTKIICGDLNVFGSLKIYNLFAFIPFNYKVSDLFFDERN